MSYFRGNFHGGRGGMMNNFNVGNSGGSRFGILPVTRPRMQGGGMYQNQHQNRGGGGGGWNSNYRGGGGPRPRSNIITPARGEVIRMGPTDPPKLPVVEAKKDPPAPTASQEKKTEKPKEEPKKSETPKKEEPKKPDEPKKTEPKKAEETKDKDKEKEKKSNDASSAKPAEKPKEKEADTSKKADAKPGPAAAAVKEEPMQVDSPKPKEVAKVVEAVQVKTEEKPNVRLCTYNSELHMCVAPDQYEASNMTGAGFEYMWGGIRATHGVNKGKVCFEVHLLENISVILPDEKAPNVVRVGWSVDGSDFQLGEDKLSWGYGGTGKSSYEGKFRDYGKPFGAGDIVMCYVDLDANPKAMFFMVNGQYLGVAFRFTNELAGKAVYPHVACKNMKFKVNFGQEPPAHPLTSNFRMMSALAADELESPPHGPRTPQEAEMIMMVGLPACGKSVWCENYAKEHKEKKYYILGTNLIIDRMKVTGLIRRRNYHGRWEELIKRASAVLNRLFDVAKKRPRNYILDQTNVYFTARRRKMESFRGYKRIAAVIVNTPDVLDLRTEKQRKDEGKLVPEEAVMEMKKNFSLPEVGPSFDDIWYLEEKLPSSRSLVQAYREEGIAFKNKRPFNGPGGPNPTPSHEPLSKKAKVDDRSPAQNRGGFNNANRGFQPDQAPPKPMETSSRDMPPKTDSRNPPRDMAPKKDDRSDSRKDSDRERSGSKDRRTDRGSDKGRDSGHRDDRRGPPSRDDKRELPRGDPSRDRREPPSRNDRREPPRDNRDRDHREPPRDSREPTRNNRDMPASRDVKDAPPRDIREPPRDNRGPPHADNRDLSRGSRVPPPDTREPPRDREPQPPRDMREQAPPRDIREPQPPRDMQEPRDMREPLRDNREPPYGERREPPRDYRREPQRGEFPPREDHREPPPHERGVPPPRDGRPPMPSTDTSRVPPADPLARDDRGLPRDNNFRGQTQNDMLGRDNSRMPYPDSRNQGHQGPSDTQRRYPEKDWRNNSSTDEYRSQYSEDNKETFRKDLPFKADGFQLSRLRGDEGQGQGQGQGHEDPRNREAAYDKFPPENKPKIEPFTTGDVPPRGGAYTEHTGVGASGADRYGRPQGPQDEKQPAQQQGFGMSNYRDQDATKRDYERPGVAGSMQEPVKSEAQHNYSSYNRYDSGMGESSYNRGPPPAAAAERQGEYGGYDRDYSSGYGEQKPQVDSRGDYGRAEPNRFDQGHVDPVKQETPDQGRYEQGRYDQSQSQHGYQQQGWSDQGRANFPPDGGQSSKSLMDVKVSDYAQRAEHDQKMYDRQNPENEEKPRGDQGYGAGDTSNQPKTDYGQKPDARYDQGYRQDRFDTARPTDSTQDRSQTSDYGNVQNAGESWKKPESAGRYDNSGYAQPAADRWGSQDQQAYYQGSAERQNTYRDVPKEDNRYSSQAPGSSYTQGQGAYGEQTGRDAPPDQGRGTTSQYGTNRNYGTDATYDGGSGVSTTASTNKNFGASFTSNSNQNYNNANDRMSYSYQTQMTTSTANYSQMQAGGAAAFPAQRYGNDPASRPADTSMPPSQQSYGRPANDAQSSMGSAPQAPPQAPQAPTQDSYGSAGGAGSANQSYEQQQQDYQKAYKQWYANYAQAYAQLAQQQPK